MLTINLEKELLKQNKRENLNKGELLNLREYSQHKELADNDILERVGINSSIKEGKKIAQESDKKLIETKQFDQERVFHISQIQSLCDKYYLRFLQTKHYKGTIDKELPNKISLFETATGIKFGSLRDDYYKHRSFIVAPAESFNLQPIPKDPLFFYEINEDYFYLIHKWGNDLSLFRRCKSLLSNGVVTYLIINLILLGAKFLLHKLLGVNDDNSNGASMYFSTFIYLIVTCSYSFITFVNEFDIRLVKKNEWRSEYMR